MVRPHGALPDLRGRLTFLCSIKMLWRMVSVRRGCRKVGFYRTEHATQDRRVAHREPISTEEWASGKSTFVEFGNVVPGAFTPGLAKHSKSFSLIDFISVGVDRMQRTSIRCENKWMPGSEANSPMSPLRWSSMKRSLKADRSSQTRCGGTVRDLYFEPKYQEFCSRRIWSLSNAFTSASKELDSIPQLQPSWQSSAKPGSHNRSGLEQSRRRP
jgi:hypothetical protein